MEKAYQKLEQKYKEKKNNYLGLKKSLVLPETKNKGMGKYYSFLNPEKQRKFKKIYVNSLIYFYARHKKKSMGGFMYNPLMTYKKRLIHRKMHYKLKNRKFSNHLMF